MQVVAAALVRGSRVLAAHRSSEPIGWEFPGGKVEPDEEPRAALSRELLEELGVHAVVGAWLGRATDDRVEIVLYAASSEDEPQLSGSHDAFQWVDADGLGEVDWLPIDGQLVDAVRALLERDVQG